ncbi:tripartite-type tricarboxylate transporter receptor subunit TctC [Arthrobacter pigmenti]|uniref:Tripartite-type tricarboxylate transporter receptor subunit TctC n=1 Tax=Arthrobacter pigmenti TaxID=271432 RepID=A0A846RIG4_9MICC|nr:tripartite tricarboxylate transporter substrate binding protein [Arthrobacter pigmenti]NJC21480.1 tripartite-type tricarboxylate transporter receptor subunit TctC [Arthrobacter pigmenti]
MATQSTHRSDRSSRLRIAAFGGIIALSGSLTACGGNGSAGADEDFPSSQIEMIVPWAAGGGTDLTTRQLAAQAEETCGTRIIISNQTGAAGATGHQAIADADPDGYTIGTATVEVSILNHLGNADVTPEDLQGIVKFQSTPSVLAVSSDSPYETFEDLVNGIEDGDQVHVATNGRGGIWDLAARGLGEEAGVGFTEYVPFDGAAGMIPAVLGGQVEALTPSGAEMRSQIEAGELRGLVTMSEERFEVLPDIPTTEEEGIEWKAANWFGVVAPAGTPEDRVEKLTECFTEAANTEEFQNFMAEQGYGSEVVEGEEFEQFMDDEFAKYEDLVATLY